MRTFYMNSIPNEAFKIAQPLPRFTGRADVGREGLDAQGQWGRSYAAPSGLIVGEWIPVMAAKLPANQQEIVDSPA